MNIYIPRIAMQLIVPAITFFLFATAGIASDSEQEGDHHEGSHQQTIALFVGATRAHGENEPTLGLEFAFKINKNWGAGVLIERADREIDTTLILFGGEYHPTNLHNLGLQLAVGRKDPSGEQENVVRAGIGYEYYFSKNWFIKPFYARDFIEHHDDEDVFGAYIGYGF